MASEVFSRAYFYIHLNGGGRRFLRKFSTFSKTNPLMKSCSRLKMSKKLQMNDFKNTFGNQANGTSSLLRLLSSSSSKQPLSSSSADDHDDFLPTDSDDDSEEARAEDEEELRVEDVKERILSSAMNFVPQYGWSKEALAKGAESAGLSPMSHALLMHNGYDLVSHHYRQANQQLAQHLKNKVATRATSTTDTGTTSTFIEEALKHRLSLNIPYMTIWPQAMVLMTQPQNIPDAFKNMATLMDDIWFYAGDTSLDHNYYTKRLLLAGVYKSTELFMVGQDTGTSVEDYNETWEFLKRRMAQVDMLGSCVSMVSKAPGFVTSLMEVSRNVLSLNNLRRRY